MKDLDASVAFFGALGFEFDSTFTDETATMMVVNEQAAIVLLTEERLAGLAARPVARADAGTRAIVCVSADSREGVDALADAALAAGATSAEEAELGGPA